MITITKSIRTINVTITKTDRSYIIQPVISATGSSLTSIDGGNPSTIF